MKLFCSSSFLLLGLRTTDAFLVGGPRAGVPSVHQMTSTSSLMESTVPEIQPDEGSPEENTDIVTPTESSVEMSSEEPSMNTDKSSFPKERHTIYVGNIPYGSSVPEIRELFAEHVDVQYVSLPRNSETGEIKGFAFIDLASEDEIPKAVKALNGVEVEGRSLRVSKVLPKGQIQSRSKFDDSNKLFVGNLPFDATSDELVELFSQFGDIADVFLPVDSLGESRGYGFVTVAEGQLEKVLEGSSGVEMMGRALIVNRPLGPGEKAERKKRRRPKRQKLYVGNLSFYTTEDMLADVFEEFGEVYDCYIPEDPDRGSSRGFGFVTMDMNAADEAIDALDGCELDGRIIAVNPARTKRAPEPADESWGDEEDI